VRAFKSLSNRRQLEIEHQDFRSDLFEFAKANQSWTERGARYRELLGDACAPRGALR
jgi:hypothetical protein